jgi:asparagine synthase (glutamine-hydrolysing)
MFRYLAFIWNTGDRSQAEAAKALSLRANSELRDFCPALDRSGLYVIYAGAIPNTYDARVMPNESGVVLGVLYCRNASFEDDSLARAATLGWEQSREIVRSNGRRMISHYWGDYVAIIPDETIPNLTRVVKDPTGNLPCFCTIWQGVTIIFSCIADCLDLGLQFSVNWSFVAHRIGGGCFDTDINCLNEVFQVGRGECLQLGSNSASGPQRAVYWNPVDFAESGAAIENVHLAATAMRATIRSVTHTLANCHAGILLRLSGGLDSSIIASCLRNVPGNPAVTAFTCYVPQGNSDERRWARHAARHLGLNEHIEHAVDTRHFLIDGIRGMRPLAAPVPLMGYLGGSLNETRAAEARGHTAIFSGDGGDSTFGGEAIGLVIDDFLSREHLKWRIIPLAAQVALYKDSIIWKILLDGLRRWCFGARMHDFRERLMMSTGLGAKAVRDSVRNESQYPHTWFRNLDHVPWRTIWRMGNLLNTPTLYDPFRDAREMYPQRVAPLYAQPVVELALSIPLYVHFLHGNERGLARRAFADDIPAAICRRRWKDRVPGSFEDMTLANREFIRETLGGGNLARKGLINTDAIDELLGGGGRDKSFFVGELYTFMDLELWSRHFHASRDQRGAVDRAFAKSPES